MKAKYLNSLGILVLFFCFYVGTFFMCVATVNYFLILNGYLFRKTNRKLHVTLMSLGIFSDLLLVIILELQRDAIATAFSFKLNALNQAHIFFSSLATALYIPMVITGIMIVKKAKFRVAHRRLGLMVLLFRTLGFVLMFSMIKSLKNV